MRSRIPLAACVVLAVLVGSSAFGTNTARATVTGQDTSTLDDQVELSLTVYNSDLALVRDVRNVELAPGTSDLRFMDIAATVNPATVHFRSLTQPPRVHVVEQNYEYDLLEPEKLLRKYVGRDVTLVRKIQEAGSTREEEVTAHLVSYNSAPVWRIGKEIVTGLQADHIRFPELPGNLYSRPTLIWTLDNRESAQHRVEAAYLAGKLSWNADYVLTVARNDKAADLDGWVTLANDSGTSFRQAALQLVAGNLNRVRNVMADDGGEACRLPRAGAAARRWRRSRSPNITCIRSADKTTINNNETKQVSMLSGTVGPGSQALRRRRPGVLLQERSASQAPRSKTTSQVYYEFKNDAALRAWHADAGWCGAGLSGGFEGRRAVRGRGLHRPHAERRDVEAPDWDRVRRRLRTESGRLREDCPSTTTRWATRSCCGITSRRRSRSK